MIEEYIKKNEENKRKQIDDIVDILFTDTVPWDEAEELRLWLTDGNYPELKDKALYRKFTGDLRSGTQSQYAPEMWPELAQRLGISYDPFAGGHQAETTEKNPVTRLLCHRTAWKIAAVLAPFIIITSLTVYLHKGSEEYHTDKMETAGITEESGKGSRTVLLPDGSSVDLIDGSRILYGDDFLRDRVVEFSGEAYFRIAKMDGYPFKVKTTTITVTVLGTEFSLSAYDNASTAEIKLTTGRLSVEGEMIAQTALHAGQQLIYDVENHTVETSDLSGIEKLELMGISLDFYDRLEHILHTLGRYLDMTVEIEEGIDTDRIMVVPFSGTEQPGEAIEILRYMTGGETFDFRIENRTIYITHPGNTN